jgi:hypothetical protein
MTLLSLLRQLFRDHTRTSGRTNRKGRRKGSPMVLEALEDRVVPNAVVWNVATGGNWNDANNWLDQTTNTSHVPTSLDNVTISQSNITITVSDSESAHSLQTSATNDLVIQMGGALTLGTASQLNGGFSLSGGSLTNNGTLTLDGTSSWSSGTIGGTGTLDNTGTLTLSGSSGTSLSLGENLSNSGSLIITSGTTLDANGGLSLSGGSLTDNGTLSLDGTSGWSGGTIGGTGTVDNTGTLTLSGGTTLSLGGNLSNGGTLTINSGTTLDVNGSLSQSGGSLTNNGAITLDGTGSWSSGTIGGTGTLDNNGTLTLSGGTTLTLGGNLDNSGTLTINSGTTLDVNGDLSQSGGSLTNNGTITLDGTGSWSSGTIGGSGTLDNSGALTLSGGTTLTLGGNLSSSGTLTIDSGTTLDVNGSLSLSGGSLTNDGSITLDGTGNWSSGTIGGTGTLDNAGTLTLSGGTTLTLGGDLGNSGTLTINSGTTLDVNGSLSQSGGSLTDNGTITLDGTGSWSSGTIGGSGTLENTGTLTLSGGTTLTLGGNLSSSGTLTIDSGTTLDVNGGLTLSGGSLTNNGTLSLDGTGSWSGGTIDGSGTVENTGTLTLSGGSSLSLGQDLGNGGTLTIDSGTTLSLDGNFTQGSSGTLDFQLGGKPASGQFGQVSITGGHSATLDGTLEAQLVPGYVPSVGDDFTVMTYPSNSGTTFAVQSLPVTPQVMFQGQVGNGGVVLNSSAETAPAIIQQPSNTTANAGQTASFTATASGNPTPAVQWQVHTPNSIGFTDIPGATSTTLSFTPAAGDNGNQYRAVFTNHAGTATSSAASLTVHYVTVTATGNPSNKTVNAGSSVSFTAAASANPANPTVQWQVNKNDGNGFVNISGATATTLTFTTTASQNGYEYQAVFTNSVNISATTTAATLTVDFAPTVTAPPGDVNTNAGQTASFTAAASANPTASVQWQVSTDHGHTFNNIQGATLATYSFTAAAADNGNEYRAVFTNNLGTATTSAATLTVDFAPTITTPPSSLTVNAGQGAAFSAAASANPTASVQWQVSTDHGANFNNISGATSTTLSFIAAAGQSGNEYRAVFTNSVGTATTTAATLTVHTPPTITAQPSNVAAATGQTATFTASATSSSAVQWQVSTDHGRSFTDITGATSTTLSFTVAPAANGRQYRAVFTNNDPASATSNAASLVVVPSYMPLFASTNHATFGLGSAGTFTIVTVGSPRAALSLVSNLSNLPTGLTFTDKGNGTATISGTPAAGTNGTYHFAIAAFNGKSNVQSFTLTVSQVVTQPTSPQAPFVVVQPNSQTVTAGSLVTFTAQASANPAARVQWQVSTDGGATFRAILGAIYPNLNVAAYLANNGYLYRAKFTNSLGTAMSATATLSVVQATRITSLYYTAFTSGTPKSFTITTSAASPPSLSIIGGLPAGLAFHDNGDGTATLSGTAMAGSAGIYTVDVIAESDHGFAIQTFTLYVR